MKYVGSKNRIAKYILPIMLAERKLGQWWVEPFVGGANIIDKVSGNRIGNDINEYLIALLIAVRDGYVPPTYISREMYYAIKSNPQEYPKELVGFVGFLCSFSGTWFGGYAFDKRRNYAAEGSRHLVRQAKNLEGVIFKCGDYRELEIPEKSLIYCDPPYANTRKYKDGFNHDIFWEWCRKQAKAGHTVFVSEYEAPDDFICVKEIKRTFNFINHSCFSKIPDFDRKRLIVTEKLFRYKYENL